MLIDSARYNIKYVININALRKRFITAVYTTECTVQLYPVHHFTVSALKIVRQTLINPNLYDRKMKAREEIATRKQGKSTDGSTVHGFDMANNVVYSTLLTQ